MHPERDVYIVTTSDCTLFRCHVERIGVEHTADTDRWIFTRADGLRFVGPAAMLARTADELRVLVEDWWQDRKAGRYANTTAETMRAKLMAEDN